MYVLIIMIDSKLQTDKSINHVSNTFVLTAEAFVNDSFFLFFLDRFNLTGAPGSINNTIDYMYIVKLHIAVRCNYTIYQTSMQSFPHSSACVWILLICTRGTANGCCYYSRLSLIRSPLGQCFVISLVWGSQYWPV